MDNHSSFVQREGDKLKKKFCKNDNRCQCFKTFFINEVGVKKQCLSHRSFCRLVLNLKVFFTNEKLAREKHTTFLSKELVTKKKRFVRMTTVDNVTKNFFITDIQRNHSVNFFSLMFEV
jgi:hypothetical protein